MIPRIIIPLHSRRALEQKTSGGKAFRLAHLLREGLPVPDGFVIATSLHRRLFPSNGIYSQSASSTEFPNQLPKRIRENIVKVFHRLNRFVSVRSSMIGEDSVKRSFAGQLRTVLNVTSEEDLFEAIRECYASVEEASFRNYSSGPQNIGEPDQSAVAILIQQMVPSRAAGVAFSADPNTGKRCVIIEATSGLGDKLVSGKVVPDRYIIDHPKIIARMDVSSNGRPFLNQEQIRRLSNLVGRIHTLMQSPQDIEWVWDGSQFWVLQSRPITTLYRQHLFSNRLVSDMTPGLIKTLLWSTNISDMMENVFNRVFRALTGTGQIGRARLVRRFHSRLYADMTLFGKLLKRLGLPANFFEIMTHDELSESSYPRLTYQLIQSVPRVLLFIGRYGRIKKQADRFIKHHNRRLDRFRQKDWSAKRLEELHKLSLILRTQHGQTQWYMWITAMNMLVRKKLLAHFLERHVPEVTTHQLLSGLIGLKSLEPNNRMKHMATYADRLTPEDQRILLDGNDQSIRLRLRQRSAGQELILQFDDFMRRYGFLSSSGTDFTVSPWVENPNLIWKGIGRLVTSGTYGQAPDTEIARKRSLKHVCSQLQLPPRWIFRQLLRSTREHVRLRERISLLMSKDVYHMRRLYLAIGDQLVINGILSQRDDIFHLSSQELASVIDNSGDEDLLKKKVLERKKALEADAAIDMEDVFYGEPRQWPTSSGQITGHYLEGIIGSMGLAQGYARIVNDPGEIATPLTKRDILVVPHTDVGWTPLFPSIGGIVAETGGQLSHSAIIAREYGLPAVVSVRKATRIIRDGQSITIDGNRGRVYLGHIHRKKEQAR